MNQTANSKSDDDREFTDEQLGAALRDVGKQAREDAFRAGKPVHFIREGMIMALYADGREEVVKKLQQSRNA